MYHVSLVNLFSSGVQGNSSMTYLAWLIFIGAAILEVFGDAVVRKGLRGRSLMVMLSGCVMLGMYGVVVNTVKWDFSKLLGVYVAMFALVSILFGQYILKEDIPWCDLDRPYCYHVRRDDHPVWERNVTTWSW